VKNYENPSIFARVIEKIKVARFFMDHGVEPPGRATGVAVHVNRLYKLFVPGSAGWHRICNVFEKSAIVESCELSSVDCQVLRMYMVLNTQRETSLFSWTPTSHITYVSVLFFNYSLSLWIIVECFFLECSTLWFNLVV